MYEYDFYIKKKLYKSIVITIKWLEELYFYREGDGIFFPLNNLKYLIINSTKNGNNFD